MMQRKSPKTPAVRKSTAKRICVVEPPVLVITEIPFGKTEQLVLECLDSIIAVPVESEPVADETINSDLVNVVGDTLAPDEEIVEKSVGSCLPSIQCGCGSWITSKTRSKHLRTKKHGVWMLDQPCADCAV